MIENVSKVKKLLADMKWIIAFLSSSGVVSYHHTEQIVDLNLHLAVLIIVCNWGIYYILATRINETQKEQDRQRLKNSVAIVFKEFKDMDEIDFESSAKYIYELEEQRKDLGVNSFTEDKLKRLMEKIV